MVAKMGNSVIGGASPLEHIIHDSSKLRGQESNGERVYRRRIRSLKDLPVQVIRHPNYVEGGVGHLSKMTSSCATNAVRHDPVVGSEKRLKAKRLLSDGSKLIGPSRSKLSLIEVTPELGQVRGRLNVQYRGSAAESCEKRPNSRIAIVTPTTNGPSRVAASEVRSHLGLNSKETNHLKPSGAQRQSTLDQFFKDAGRKVEDVGPKQLVKHEASGVEVDVVELSKLNVSSPSKFKRRKCAGVDNINAPPKGTIFPPIPTTEDFLPLKRQKIRKNFRDGSLITDSVGIGLLSKKRAPAIERDRQDGKLPPATRKKMRKLPIGPLMQAPVNSQKEIAGLVSIPVEALGSPHSSLLPVSVPVEALEIPHSNLVPVSVSVEALGIPNSNLISVSIPLQSLRIPLTNQDPMRIPGEALRNKHSNPVPAQKERILDSGMHGRRRFSDLTLRKKPSGIKKDGTPDGRFKKREGSGFVRKSKDDTRKEPLQIVDKQALNGNVGVVHVKKLPEMQKNGVRKPKRVQLKRLFVDKPEVHLPNVNSVTNTRVVKSLWSPPKKREHTGDAGLLEPIGLHRQVKSTKFLSLQQLDASGKLNTLRVRPTCPQIDVSEDSASDRTVSDCSTRGHKQTGKFSIGTSSEHFHPQEMQEINQSMLEPLKPFKARLGKKERDINQKVAFSQLNTAAKTGKVPCGGLGSSVITKTRKKLSKVPPKMTNGDMDGGSGVLGISPRTMEQPNTVHQVVEKTTRDIEAINAVSEMTPMMRQLATVQQIEEMEKNDFEGTGNDLEVSSPMSSMKSLSAEQIPGGDCEGTNGVPRMTPRARKLTDAMQNFLHQKATLLRQWKEMELGKLHPMALIGRSCKIFWPLDSEWYPGVIHEYNPQTRRHRIDYEDDEREWVLLGKERVKLHVSVEESKALEMSFGEGSLTDHRKKLDADELAVLAAGLEGCHGELSHGDLVWAKVKGYPMWPACVMDEEHANAGGLEPSPRERTVPVQFFGSYDHSRINSKKVVPFAKGIMHKYHTKCKRTVFEQGLQEIERYLKECKLPEQMAQLQEDAVPVVNRKENDLASNEETDEEDQDFVKDESKSAGRKDFEIKCTFPLERGALRVLALGKIVRDSEQFHTENHIWTEGYTAIRKFASMKDPEKLIEYKMEVLRNPTIPSLPLFRVTPEDDRQVEASTASGCWKRILIKIQRAKEKAGLCIATLLEKKRQSFRSGPSMFGFCNRRVSKLIQALPYARVCSKFTAWIEKPLLEEGAEELAPAGYRAVEHHWEHLDRCNVCYVDEEYADNQLLQCDKCRTMVHMYCYGELEPPDGDLWLCNLCRPEAPKSSPFCCLCPVTGGAMKTTTDGRWAHLTCALWTPETCLVDVKRMEPVDGINSINKERWKLVCTVCKVPYGACIQCSKPHCRVAFHPLCARAAGLCTEVLEDKASSIPDSDGGLQLLTYCKKHAHPISQSGAVRPQSQQTTGVPQSSSAVSPSLPPVPPCNPSGCARSEPYNAASRRGHRQPEALAAALAKRFFVENKPYLVSGCQRNVPNRELKSLGGSLWSLHWKQSKSSISVNGDGMSNEDEGDNAKTLQSTSERYRHMRSTLHERLTFGKSSIHGWGVFTKRSHSAGDMVIEYAGEIVRPIIADIRELNSYDSLVGAGTYMFRIDDERVVDATHAGSIAHLINHSCEPNCYSRVVAASGEDHIIIFAKRDIREGEELTYDYRFSSKDELLTCYCGCTGCRGFVNTFDSEEEPTRIIAPRSELTKWVVP